MEGLAGAFVMDEVVILGFQDCIKDCALEADLVMSFAGASVAIDRANCLLKPVVVASYFHKSAKHHPIAKNSTQKRHTLGADILSAPSASLRHPIPFPAMFEDERSSTVWLPRSC